LYASTRVVKNYSTPIRTRLLELLGTALDYNRPTAREGQHEESTGDGRASCEVIYDSITLPHAI